MVPIRRPPVPPGTRAHAWARGAGRPPLKPAPIATTAAGSAATLRHRLTFGTAVDSNRRRQPLEPAAAGRNASAVRVRVDAHALHLSAFHLHHTL